MFRHLVQFASGEPVGEAFGSEQELPADECGVLPEPVLSLAIPVMTPAILASIEGVQDKMLALPQVEIHTEHFLHAGVYVRTIRLAAEIVLVGALVKIPTTLIISGRTKVFTGAEWIELDGYHVIPAQAGRKQIFVTQAKTTITMIFRTDATTVEKAEEEFTDEHESLMSRKEGVQ